MSGVGYDPKLRGWAPYPTGYEYTLLVFRSRVPSNEPRSTPELDLDLAQPRVLDEPDHPKAPCRGGKAGEMVYGCSGTPRVTKRGALAALVAPGTLRQVVRRRRPAVRVGAAEPVPGVGRAVLNPSSLMIEVGERKLGGPIGLFGGAPEPFRRSRRVRAVAEVVDPADNGMERISGFQIG